MNHKETSIMLRQELQKYFDRVYPFSKIDTEHTLGGQVHIRFELGGEELENGTIERVNQATERALTLFQDTFDNPNNDIWVLIYEYQGHSMFNASKEFLYKQFTPDIFDKFYNELETVNTCYYTKDDKGNDVLEQAEVRVLIGRLTLKDFNIKNILNGIANTEMGFESGIDQDIYFYDTKTDRAFQMYDDRGCLVWSDNADKIRVIYKRRNDWIVDYHRPVIDEYFK
jgi:hypothetical protein